MKVHFSPGAVAILVLSFCSGFVSGYSLVDTVIGTFYRFFAWEAIADPTHGRVNYVSQTTSNNSNLTFASSDTFTLRVDHTTVLSASGAGRNSVRIKSLKTYTQHVAIFDVRHMPQGYRTWPAIWESKESNWPVGGEIDIVEGVSDQSPNSVTLHTTSGCRMPTMRNQTGTSISYDCSYLANNNEGCSVKMPTSASYGSSFNSIGGGWYAIERTSTDIKVWFWPRDLESVPSDVKSGSMIVNPRAWGIRGAHFLNTNCDFSSHLQEHNIIINLTFCGHWAGATYSSSGCSSTCIDYVDNHPSAFVDAYFDFASIRVYE